MAVYKIMSVLDKVAHQWGMPFYAVSEGSAARSLDGEVNDQSGASMIARYPHDYDLYCLGEFNDSTAEFSMHAQAVHVVGAASLVRPSAVLSEAKGSGNPVGAVHSEDVRHG